MADFDFNIDSELADMRRAPVQPKGGAAPKPAATEAPRKPAPKVDTTAPKPVPTENPVLPEPEGFGVKQGHQEANSGSSDVRAPADPVNWKKFKTMSGVFEHVGGVRPVLLKEHIKRSQVSGLPEPMMLAIQDSLRERYKGAVVDFPWGSYKIDDHNRVFTTKSSLMRYLMFDAFRDEAGSQLQYAKQWMVLHHLTVFDANFRPDMLKQASDELDIYALILVSTLSEKAPGTGPQSEGEHQLNDQIRMLNTNMNRVFERLNDQDATFDAYAERSIMIQTVMLLDRMGLLRGGLPKDTGAFMRVLEQNRDELEGMSSRIDEHLTAEQERKRTMAREERLRAFSRG